MNLKWLLLPVLFLSGCVSQTHLRNEVRSAHQSEIDYAKHLAERVENNEMTAHEMGKFLEDREFKNSSDRLKQEKERL